MSLNPPRLDKRDFDSILAQLREAAKRYMPDWTAGHDPGADADPGVMLQHTFARLMEIVIERLNRVPEKQMLAFLHEMNISPLPPVPARAPLLFSLKKDTDAFFVPARTQITAKTSGGPSPIFETTADLSVLPSSITCAYTLEPERRRYADYTNRLSGSADGFTPFIGEDILPDDLFFVSEQIPEVEDPAKTTLSLTFSEYVSGGQIERVLLGSLKTGAAKWRYYGEEGEKALTLSVERIATYEQYRSITFTLHDGEGKALSLKPSPGLGGGRENGGGYYLRLVTDHDVNSKEDANAIQIDSARLSLEENERPPAYLFYQNSKLEPEGYILPFGNRPKPGDSFYIHIGDLSEEVQNIAVTLSLIEDVLDRGKAGLAGKTLHWKDLLWSYSSPDGWRLIEKNDIQAVIIENTAHQPVDHTYAMTFPLANPFPRKVGGEEGVWLRAMLPSIPADDFGSEIRFTIGAGNRIDYEAGTGVFVYPKIRSLDVRISFSTHCVIQRQYAYLYTNARDPRPPLEDAGFYLGFDILQPFWSVSLYADTAPAAYYAAPSQGKSAVWECLTGDGWRRLYVHDDTAGFSYSGPIRFLTPPEALCAPLFDNTPRYWVRLARDSGVKLNSLYLNAVPAEQAVSVARENLGVSSGNADQRFNLRGAPVLTGQRIWVREDETPSAAELAETEMEVKQNLLTFEQENWILWKEQNSFGSSLPNSRHYTLDRSTGEILFGDGSRGMVPLNGSHIAAEYRYGGGSHGNLPEGAIAKLPGSLSGIEEVFNPIPSTGGADPENTRDVLSRGPMSLRHRGRGVTAEDIEWLVKEVAGAAVDRIRCLPADEGQLFTLLLLPASEDPRPLPDGAMSARIREYLEQRLPASTPAGSFGIVGPSYVTIHIDAEIVPKDPFESSAVRDRAAAHLQTFLHPRRGGLDGGGWSFGRNVYLSEICAALESVEGVAYSLAPSVKIQAAATQRELTLQTSDSRVETLYPAGSLLTVYNRYMQQSSIVFDQWLLAEPIVTDLLPSTIRVTGFREGDVLHIICHTRGDKDVPFPSPVWTESGIMYISYDPDLFPTIVNNSSRVDFPAGSRLVFQDGCEVQLKEPLRAHAEITEDMLDMEHFVCRSAVHSSDHYESEDPEHGGRFVVRFNTECDLTLIHPDEIPVTGVLNHDDGSYEITALRPSRDLLLPGGTILACARNRVKGILLQDHENHVTYHEDLSMTLRFHGFRPNPGQLSRPLNVSLALPDGKSHRLDFQIAGSKLLLDTAYLFDRELCTPGEIQIQIAK